MVQLALTHLIEHPRQREWASERTFDSVSGPWTAYFHDPFEWHMGADGWNLSILSEGTDVTTDHPEIGALVTGKGFHLPRKYQPWCAQRPILALHAWDDVIHFYDVAHHRHEVRHSQFPLEIQWAPNGAKLAVTLENHISILDPHGDRVSGVPVRHLKYEHPEVFWWPDGIWFFVVNRESETSKTNLALFDARTGRLVARVDLHPGDLIPYDEDEYRKIPRDRYSLFVGSGTRSIGSLLDRWSRLEFDPGERLLRAYVYRPTGPCEEIEGQYMCAAEERGVEVEISA